MPWTMTLKHKELAGQPPNREVRLVIEVTDGTTTFTADWNFRSAEDITLPSIRARVQDMISKEALLIAKFNQLDSQMNNPIAAGI